MPSPYRYWVAAVCWFGAALRYHSLFANTFHADEALFASLARQIAVWRDPLLLTQPVDKPPLLFYLQAFFYPFFGPVEWAARMPNFIVSVMLVPMVGLLAWRLYGDGLTAVLAATLVALSPLAIQFSATAFTDPLLTFWLVAALTMAANPRRGASPRHYPALCGVAFGLAVATKYQAWLFLPLLVALALLSGWSRRDWMRWLLAAGTVGLVVFGWLFARTDSGSPLSLQIANVGGIRTAWSWELMPRLSSWAALEWVSLGWPVTLAAGAVVGTLALMRLAKGRKGMTLTAFDAVLLLFVIGYLGVHWLLAVPVWDRYLLPILPLMLLLVARAISSVWRIAERTRTSDISLNYWGAAIAVGLIIVLLIPAFTARLGCFPIGGQPTADQGASLIARHLQDAPYGTVLYDHWYSWLWRYHLFDSGVYVSWFATPDALRRDLAVFGADDSTRYLVMPLSPEAEPVRRAVAEAGFQLVAEEEEPGSDSNAQMALYRLEQLTP